ncbi:MAG: S8 family serine peptidase [Bacteroidota bacterium]|jgi:subtilisin family serine protease|nr:S8 family serine peptidase [Bacteroidota bacterium]
MKPAVHIASGAAGLVLVLLLFTGTTHAQQDLRVFVKVRSEQQAVAGAAGLVFPAPALRETLRRHGCGAPVPMLDVQASVFAKAVGEEHPLANLYLLTPAPGADGTRLADELAALPGVLYAARETRLRLDFIPNDSAWSSQWGMQRTGMEKAWDITRGSGDITIGIIDTGIDPDHPDLRGQHWINAGEDRNRNGRFDPWPSTETRAGVAGDLDGIDDDGNGFIDDVIGYDFVDQPGAHNAAGGDYIEPDPLPLDEMGHGTSVAGIIGAAMDNGIGVAGIAPDCRMMTLRAFDARGFGAEGDVARALAYAVANGARVVNMSFGDVVYSRVLRDVIRWAHARGVVMIASAGNAQSTALHYPSAYDETISVSATAANDVLAGFSNYGQTVDIAAPGSDILTTDRDGRYTAFYGTSAAAPFVTGAAALILSRNPAHAPEEVRGMLIAAAEDLGAQGWDERYGAGILRIDRATALDHPSVVRILAPRTDFATDATEIVIRGTAASPLMRGYTLQYGIGVNPSRWNPIGEPRLRQVIDQQLAVWDVRTLPDTTYTIRLAAESDKGITLEDRVVIALDRTPARILGAVLVPAVDGASYGIAAGFTTDDATLGKLWYREQGSSAPFAWVSAEGDTRNNLFIGRNHRIYLGPEFFTPGRTYEFYLSAENAVGHETIARDTDGDNFLFTVPAPVSSFGFTRTSGSLPLGRLSRITPDFNGDGVPELLMNNIRADNTFQAWQFDGLGFSRIDGGAQGLEFPRGAGDLDGDGHPELLTSFVRNGFLYRGAAHTFPTQRWWADSIGGDFWSVDIHDVDGDGMREILAVIDDSTLGVFRFEGGAVVEEARIVNPTSPGSEPFNSFDAPRAAFGDFNNNGKPDILLGDRDADFFIAEFNGSGYEIVWGSENDFIDGGDFVAAGDFNGDGRDEFAIGFRTLDEDLVPFWFFGIFRLRADNAVEALWSVQLHGVAESAQYGSFTRIQNSLTAGNLDADAEIELVISAFPELYVVDYNRTSREFDIVWQYPLANTDAVAIADFDGNGVAEMAFATTDSVLFFERDLPYTGPEPPRGIDVSYVSSQTARISWSIGAPAPRYRLYKGTSPGAMEPMGTFAAPLPLTDPSLVSGTTVLYAVSAVDTTRTPPESPKVFSRILHPHDTPLIDSVIDAGQGQLRLAVSQDMGTVLPSPGCFRLDGEREASSVVLLDARTLLLSFGAIAPGKHGIAVRGLRDGEGVPFADATVGPFEVHASASEECYIARVDYLPPSSFAVVFSAPVDPVTAAVATNYAFLPSGTVERAEPDPADPARVLLTLGADARIGARGKEYVLTVRNVRCIAGGMIGAGAGSTAGVILNAANLDDVFVYPSPLKPEHAQQFVTFANLTARATIRIYTVSGLFIAEVRETDGNGGAEWDLRDDSGALVPAGIYIFHAGGTDAQGREVETKVGKFMIVR